MGKKSVRDSLGDRMKSYENITRNYLTRRMPVVIRLDGVCFHTFTKGFKKPFDEILWKTMQDTTMALCKDVQNCVIGYTQSDEITLVLVDYYKLNTDVWFGNNIQKIASVVASKCSVYFNKFLLDNIYKYINTNNCDYEYYLSLKTKIGRAIFDARVFNIPREEVTNCILWRQQDCIKNSITAIAQNLFSHNELDGKKQFERIEMINQKAKECNMKEYEDYKDMYRFGTFIIKNKLGEWKRNDNLLVNVNRYLFDDLFLPRN